MSRKDKIFPYILVLPGIFIVITTILTLIYSLQFYKLTKPYDKKIIGLQNYIEIFRDLDFYSSLINTSIIVVIVLIIGVIFSFIIALILNREGKISNFLTAIAIIPWALPPVVNGVIWKFMFYPEFGLINKVLYYFGVVDGVWALVGQMVTVSIFRTIALWLVAKWRPITGFSKESFKNLFGYGSKILMAGILETIYRNLYSIIIGKYYQANALGLYHRGEQFASYAASNITGVIQRVTFPVMSSLQDDTEMLNKAFIKTLRTTCFFVFPIMTYLFMVSEPLVKLILTDKWIGCVPIIQILCISYMWYTVHILNLNILQVSGSSDLFFKIEVIKKIIGLAILFGSLPFGIIIMCWGRVLYCGLELFINMYYTNHIVKTSCIQQLRHTIPFLLYCIVITIAAALFQPYISSDILKLFINFIFIVLVWLLVVQRIENLYIRDFLLILNRK